MGRECRITRHIFSLLQNQCKPQLSGHCDSVYLTKFMWWGLSIICPHTSQKKEDMMSRPIGFICSQMEKNQASLSASLFHSLSFSLCPSVSYQSIMRMRNMCGHCQLDNQGIFMISEGGEMERRLFINRIFLSVNPPTQTLYIHSPPERADPGPSF